MTQTYHVIWEIDIDADTPEEAATRALIVQRDDDPLNAAVIFDCIDEDGEIHRVDLFDFENRIRTLALEFSQRLRVTIGDANMARVIETNRQRQDGSCASQDFCDANQVMIDAFQAVFGRDVTPSDAYLIDEAWLEARKQGFWVK